MGSFSIVHWLIVLLIVMMIFGSKRLRGIGEDVGSAVRGFKDGMKASDTSSGIVDSSVAAIYTKNSKT